MIVDKITHQFDFNKIKSTSNDSLANSVVLNTSLVNQRSLTIDPYSPYVAFNLRLDMPVGSYFFADDCANLITRSSTQVIAALKDGQIGVYLDGDEYLTIANSLQFAFDSDFTIEFWAWTNSSVAAWARLLENEAFNATGGWHLSMNGNDSAGSRRLGFQLSLTGGGGSRIETDAAFPTNQWAHYACTRQSGIVRQFVNGVLQTATLSTTEVFTSNKLTIGSTVTGGNYFTGYFRDIRLTRGVARYTSTFTPAASIPEITPKGPRVYDQILGDVYSIGSTIGPALEETSGPFGGPALYFNGSTFLTLPYHKYFDLNDQTSPFTIDLWFKIAKNAALTSGSSRDMSLISFSWPNASPLNNAIAFRITGDANNSGTGLHCEVGGSSIDWISGGTVSIGKDTWHHLAICKETSNGLMVLYLDGKKIKMFDGVQNYRYSLTTGMVVKIGSDNYTNYVRSFAGWMADIRITRACRYFGDFVPQSTSSDSGDPYLADTSLLMHFNDTDKNPSFGLTNDLKAHPITVTGDATLSAGGRFGGLCAYFDGSGDKLAIAYNADYDVTYDIFTIEFWFKPMQITSGTLLVDWRPTYATRGLNIYQSTAAPNRVTFTVGDSSTTSYEVTLVSTTVLTIGQWYHVVASRSMDNQFGLWINGNLEAYTVSNVVMDIASAPLWIGLARDGTNSPFLGFLDEFRLTKGVERYPITPQASYDNVDRNARLLLNFDGTDGSTTFTDSSFYSQSVTANGNAQISTSQSKFGGSSAYFDGTGDYLTVPYNKFDLTGTWSVDFWVRPVSTGVSKNIMTFRNASNYNTPFSINLTSTNQINLLVTSGATWAISYSTTATLPINTWSHVLVQKVNNADFEIFIDGALYWRSTTTITPYTLAYDLKIGYDPGLGTSSFYGYLDDFRIIDGVATVSQAFTPPSQELDVTATTSLLLHMNGTEGSTTFTDEKGNTITPFGDAKISTAQSKFGGSSAYFDGTGDYLRLPYSSDFDLSSGNFTIEAWFLRLSTSGTQCIIAKDTYGVNFDWCIYVSNASLTCYTNATGSNLSVAIPTLQTNQWYHVAFVRSGTINAFYLDGRLMGWNTMAITNASQSYITIGCAGWNNPNTLFYGYIDDVRIIKGAGPYAKFDLPTSARTFQDPYWNNVTLSVPFNGTNGSTSFVDFKGHALTANGNAQILTDQFVTGLSSAYFDGTGDFITSPSSSDFLFGSGDFSIDFYMRPAHTSTQYGTICSVWDGGSGQRSWEVYVGAEGFGGGSIWFYWSTNGSTYAFVTFTFTYSANTWFKVLLTRSSGVMRCYVNGQQAGTDQSVPASFYESSGAFAIGTSAPLTPGEFYKGYLDQLRITKGVARPIVSESSYVTPSSPFPTNSSLDPYWDNTPILLTFEEMDNFTDVMGHRFTPIGDVKLSSFQGYSCAHFNGYGFLVTPHNDDLAQIGDFTIEGWIYPESVSGTQIIIRKPENTVTYSLPAYEIRLNGTSIQFTIALEESTYYPIFLNKTFGTVTLNTWSHFAIVRYGNLWKAFHNGVAGFTGYASHTSYITAQTTSPLAIGGDSVNRLYGFKGYLHELRFTKTIARYTSDFVPTMGALPDTGDGDSLFAAYTGLHLRFNCYHSPFVFFDEKGHPLAAYGDVTQSRAWAKNDVVSLIFDGSGDYIDTPDSADFTLGTNDFTIECWVRPSALGTNRRVIVAQGDSGATNSLFSFTLEIATDSKARGACFSGGSIIGDLKSTTSLTTSAWWHIAYVRSGSNFNLYLNGVSEATTISSSSVNDSSYKLSIGRLGEYVGNYFAGNLQDLRITNGVARYTSDFTPATAVLPNEDDTYWSNTALLVHMGRPPRGIVDELGHAITLNGGMTLSTLQSKWGGTSGYFNGVNNFISTPHSTDLSFGTGDLTIEAWIYPTSFDATMYWAIASKGASGSDGFFFGLTPTDGYLRWDLAGSIYTSSAAPSLNTWSHVAWTRSGTTNRGYINGAEVYSFTDSTNFNDVGAFRVGRGRTNSLNYATGYMDDFRLIKGVARYTSDFTPPSQPFPAFSGNPYIEATLLHLPLCGLSGNTTLFADLSPYRNSLTPTSMSYAWPDSDNAKTRGMREGFPAFFNGSSSRLAFTPFGGAFNFQRDWNIEFWFYTTTTGTNRNFYCFDGAAGTHVGHYAQITSANKIYVAIARDSSPSGASMNFTSVSTIAANTWYSVRISKRTNWVALEINGVYDNGMTLTENPEPPVLGRTAYIGCYFTPSNFFQGYITDFVMYHTYSGTYQSDWNGYRWQSVVPVEPLLKCNFEGTQFLDSITSRPLTINGSASLSSVDKKFGSQSGLFTGGSDYLSPPYLALFSYLGIDFGIEMWLKTTETAGGEQVVFKQVDAESDRQIVIKFGGVSSGHKLIVTLGDPISDTVITNLTKTDFSTSFRHLQVQKKQFGIKVYVDGACVGNSAINISDGIASSINDIALLHMNGSDNGTVFTDNSPQNRTWTAAGNAKTRTSASKFGASSAYFDGTGDYIQTASSSLFHFGTSDFTVECWFNIQGDSSPDGNGYRDATIFSGYTNGLLLNIGGNTSITGTSLYLWEGTRQKVLVLYGFVQPLTKNQWYHVAVTREKLTFRIFLDGVLLAESYDTGSAGSSSSVTDIGGNSYGSTWGRYLNGYIDEFRATKGIARYTTNFTVPTAPFKNVGYDTYFFRTPASLTIGGDGTNGFKGYIDEMRIYRGDSLSRQLTVPTQAIPDNSFDAIDTTKSPMMVTNKNVVLTDSLIPYNTVGSPIYKQNRTMALFDGASQILVKRGPDEWNELEDWTIEFWMYRFDLTTTRTIISSRTGPVYTIFLVQANTDSTITFNYTITGSSWVSISSPTQSSHTWYHIAIVRSKEVITLFQNGSAVATSTIGTSAMRMAAWQATTLNIGGDDQNSMFYGYLKGLQFIRGYAKYLTTFTPSQEDLSYFEIDFYRKPLISFSPKIISHYRLGDTGTTLEDFHNDWDLNLVDPDDVLMSQTPLIPYNDGKDDSVYFDGGYGEGPSQSVLGKDVLSFHFFIRTTSTSGEIIKKEGAYKIELSLGKIHATFYVEGDIYQVTGQTAINDDATHQVVVDFKQDIVCIVVDGVLDAVFDKGIVETDFKCSELKFDGSTSSAMLQLRCNDGNDDCQNQVVSYGNTPIIINDSPFATKSMYFDGTYHLEIPRVSISRQQSLTSVYYPTTIDFTIEFWVKMFANRISTNPIIWWGNPLGTGGSTASLRTGFGITIKSDVLNIQAGNLSQGGALANFNKKAPSAFLVDTWYHIAITCKDHFIRLYQDGIEQTLAFTDYANAPSNSLVNSVTYTTDNLNIGGAQWNQGLLSDGTSTSYRATGLSLDDIRITRGVIYG